MRTVTLALLAPLALAGTTAVHAADLDYGVLRGPEYEAAAPEIDWNGVYVGGHAGYTATSFGFGAAGQSDLAQILRSTAVETQYKISQSNRLKPGKGHDLSFGGFAGYNYQFADTVFGIEADYTSINQKVSSQDSLSRNATLSSGIYDVYTIATNARSALMDYETIRARGGVILGPLLLYATGGVAIGRANVGSAVSVALKEYADQARTRQVGGLDQAGGTIKERYQLGSALGAGVDYAITQSVFLRAEYQYVNFGHFGDYKIHLSTIRSALGVKF